MRTLPMCLIAWLAIFGSLLTESPLVDQRAYERLLGLGVDAFATDYPEVTLAAVRSFREKKQK
jgi:hypothetical protein